ncbi:MAG: helicase-related protein [Acutalibacteraceae bacterium]|nr:helicase-related protein [Acutalibacteraceae bacterium]
MTHNALYIVDNSDEKSSVKKYLLEWCSVSKQMDIATGYFEIGGLLTLDEDWQKLDKIRIILGNEMTKRTKEVIDEVAQTLIDRFRSSIEKEQEKNEFLIGVPAIIEAMKSGKIECRIYDSSKFHAKAYITYFSDEYLNQFISAMNIPSGYALVGSSNFTKAGLTQNIELNVQVKDEVEALQEWFEKHWQTGTDITEAVLKVIENHCREFSPYDVYLRSMYEYFKSHEKTVSEWEANDSVIYKGLSQYQRDGYNSLIQIADKYSGAFLCDGVGLGKTYVGMMLIERFVKKERKNVVLIVPASARVSVWEITIKKLIPEILEGFYPFKIINHTDLLLDKNQNLMNQIAEQAEIIIMDEAHHFRNRSSNRYRKLFEMMQTGTKKKMFMLTATPINNSFLDLQHLIELFTHRQDDYFSSAPLGIHSLSGHFKKMEKQLDQATGFLINDTIDISGGIIKADKLVNELVVQRSRAYVKRSLQTEGGTSVLFSRREPPTVANYSLKKSYGKLIKDFKESFERKDKNGKKITILSLAIYSPYGDDYFIGDKSKMDDMVTGRQQQVVNLIRILLLKRFESSIEAFKETCIKIYIRLNKFLNDYKEYDASSKKRIERKQLEQADILAYAEEFTELMQTSIEDIEDDLPDYVWNTQEEFNADDFDINALIFDTLMDMDTLSKFIRDMMEFNPENDDKIRELKRILTEDERVKGKKVIIFSEYRATALYIYRELEKAGFTNLFEIDGQTKGNRHEMIQRFAPYYNDCTSANIENEIQVLIATDVLAEGLNLQDASCLINYELHWNPVKLMQRIGRIDRRRNAEIEQRLLADHPELTKDRESAYYWNFLPPTELEQLLSLYKTVSKKTLRISKTFGIEGEKLLTPDDEYEALKEFNSKYEGTTSGDEEIALAYQELMADNPDYLEQLNEMPKKLFSGKLASTRKGYFFCYELPNKKSDGSWSNGDGIYRWYFIDPENKLVSEDMYEIWNAVKCTKEEPRVFTTTEEEFSDIRKMVESHIKKTYLKAIQAPVGKKAKLITWLQMI